jgi:cobalt-zinc-cadmium resistance protein CzcA
MLERIIGFAIAHRLLMLLLVLAASAVGVMSFRQLPIDATPDITNVQVQINTEAPGYSPLEAEQRVTFPIETALAGLPRLDYTRSLSRYGLSQVTVVFEDGTDIYFARQQVAERCSRSNRSCPTGWNRNWARSPPGWARSSCTRWKPSPEPRKRRRPALDSRPTCARCRTGWCARSCATCVASPRSTPSVATRGRSTSRPTRPGWSPIASPCRTWLRAISAQQPAIGAGYIERNGQQYLVACRARSRPRCRIFATSCSIVAMACRFACGRGRGR